MISEGTLTRFKESYAKTIREKDAEIARLDKLVRECGRRTIAGCGPDTTVFACGGKGDLLHPNDVPGLIDDLLTCMRLNLEDAEERARFEKEGREVQARTVVSVIGGTVEGAPTQTINYLQRLRELVQVEKESAETRKQALWDAAGLVCSGCYDNEPLDEGDPDNFVPPRHGSLVCNAVPILIALKKVGS